MDYIGEDGVGDVILFHVAGYRGDRLIVGVFKDRKGALDEIHVGGGRLNIC